MLQDLHGIWSEAEPDQDSPATVIRNLDGTWQPIFLRCGIADGCMAIAPFGDKIPQEVKDAVAQAEAEIEAGTLVVFAGSIMDQDGTVRVPEGEVLSADAMSSVDWFVKGVVGSPK